MKDINEFFNLYENQGLKIKKQTYRRTMIYSVF